MTFDFFESGEGPTILMVPGSFSTAAAWAGMCRHLRGTYRVITISLPGYGGTPEVRPDLTRDMTEMTDFLAAVVDRVGEPVHLVGHSFGGLTILAALLGRKVAAESVVTFEANPVASKPAIGAFPWRADIDRLQHALEESVACGDPDAPGLIIDYWSHPGTFDALPEAVRNYCRKTVATNVLDWRSALGFAPRIADFSEIGCPATIVRGEHASPAIVDLSQGIADQICGGAVQVVQGADHFLVATHPADCAAILERHMCAFQTRAA